jgi:uncharacterized membrane protein YfcA
VIPPQLGYPLALFIGLSLGLLGGGGSILTIPVLHYIMQYPVKAAVPMSLVVVGFTSGLGALAHWRGGTVNLRTAIAFGPPAIVGALLGAELGLRASARLQLTVFAIVMLLAAASMLFGPVKPTEHPLRKPIPLITLIGGLVGILTGFVGVGGGFLYVPALEVLGGLPIKQAVGTSLLLIVISCVAGVARYHGSLQLDWPAIGLFTLIALVGVQIGARLVRRVSQASLRHGFGVLVLLMGALVLFRGR